jgi:hypothetical protein
MKTCAYVQEKASVEMDRKSLSSAVKLNDIRSKNKSFNVCKALHFVKLTVQSNFKNNEKIKECGKTVTLSWALK